MGKLRRTERRAMPSRWLLVGCAAAVFATSCATTPDHPPAAPVEAPARLEPSGALNADVTQATIHQTICVSGWAATVRPSSSYSSGIK